MLDFARDRAHLLLGGIRFLNGVVALLAPGVAARRLGVDPDANPAPIYPLRMFGVRTAILGAELLAGSPEVRKRSARLGVLIHASDTAAAAWGGLRGGLPPRTAAILTGVSTLNTVLAILAALPHRRRRWARLRR